MFYKVSLATGRGIWLCAGNDIVVVDARDEEDALVQASLEIGDFIPLSEIDDVEEFEAEHPDYDYLDRSEYGEENGYLWVDCSYVRECDEDGRELE